MPRPMKHADLNTNFPGSVASCARGRTNVSLILAVALIAILLAACQPAQPVAPPQKRLNLLLVTIDTLRADRLGAYGYAGARTPTMDGLARGGVRFDQSVSAAPLTLPAHATILSGWNPQHHGLRNNGAGSFPDNLPTLASHLSEQGYRTAAFVGSFVLDHRFGLGRGFEKYDDEVDRFPGVSSSLEAERDAGRVIDRASAWMNQQQGDFFLWVHLFDAHAPYAPPEPYRSMLPDPYDGEIAYIDSQLARLVAALDRSGLRERTMIVLVGDHGESLGEHGEPSHGLLLYESTLRVPMILNGPGLPQKNIAVKTPVGLADLAPTTASLIGLPFSALNETLDGRDLSADLLAGREPAAREIYSETEYPRMFGWSGLAAMRRGADKYIDAPNAEMYDLDRDPGERTNLLDVERRTVNELRGKLAEARRVTRETQVTKIDAESAAKLASLGYVTGRQSASSSGADPKAMISLFAKFQEANGHLSTARARTALGVLEELVAADPKNPLFRSTLAKALRQQGETVRALSLDREAVNLSPEDADAWYNLATGLQQAGRHDESEAALREVLRLDPLRAEARNTLGVLHATKGKVDLAAEDFRAATQLDPRNAEAFNNLGNALRARGETDQAEAAYRRAVEIAPSYGDPLNGLGTLAVQRNRPQVAVTLFDRALHVSPQLHEARLNRAISLEVMGKKKEAVNAYENFLIAVAGDARFATERATARNLMKRLTSQNAVVSDGEGK